MRIIRGRNARACLVRWAGAPEEYVAAGADAKEQAAAKDVRGLDEGEGLEQADSLQLNLAVGDAAAGGDALDQHAGDALGAAALAALAEERGHRLICVAAAQDAENEQLV